MKPIDHHSLPRAVANKLADLISKEHWKSTLPGYRVLCDQLQVSPRTCRKALEILELEGHIEPAVAGKPRKILKKALKQQKTSLNLLIIEDTSSLKTTEDSKIIHGISEFWQKKFGEVYNLKANYSNKLKAEKTLHSWVEKYSATHILIKTPTYTWSRAILNIDLPCYFLGGEFGDIDPKTEKIAGSAFSISHSFEDLFKRLKTIGHNKLLISSFSHLPYERLKLIYEQVYDTTLRGTELEFIFPGQPGTTPAEWDAFWEKHLHQLKPTIVITNGLLSTLSLYTYCQKHQLQIPNDISLINFGDDDAFAWISPVPTRYKYPYELSLKSFKKWANRKFAPQEFEFLPLRIVEGETIRRI